MDLQPPEALHGPRITLRRYRMSDAAAIRDAIALSLENLRPWMPWAQSPPTEESVLAFLVPAAERFGGTAAADYAMILRDAEQYVGGCGMMPRIGPGAVEIGYWVHAAFLRRGIATEASRLLTNAALALPGITRVEIHCDEANVPSQSVARSLGFRLDRVEADRAESPGEVGRSMIWVTEAPV
jgi:RimJ/RimL family protein N-acetyltransferase